MELTNVTYRGPAFDATSPTITVLPANLLSLLQQTNGFVQFGGGLHVRGVCEQPLWHSLTSVLAGPLALHKSYDALLPTDVPFAQDCMADQFVLRDGNIFKLWSETGEMESLDLNLPQFFKAAEANSVEFLGMEPLLRFESDGNSLQPGQVLHAYPPFCTEEAANGVSLRAVSIVEALQFLAGFSRQLSGLAPGERFEIRIVP